jgi:thiol-disulfide isomerase/thioredoxin
MYAAELKRYWIWAMAYIAFSWSSFAQGTVVVFGQIDNPTARQINIEYKKNLFSMEEGNHIAHLDGNNAFSFRVMIDEPRALLLNYNNTKAKLFLVPNDTLRIRFDGKNMLSTMKFESGLVALPNKFLAKAVKQFPDITSDNYVNYVRKHKSPRDYQRVVDSIYFEKRRFLDEYPAEDKDYFSSEFADFIISDITYSRTFQLMQYYRDYGLNNKDNTRFIDDIYFNFLFDTDNIFYKGLNNENYINFLEIYLAYKAETENLGKKTNEFVEEKSRSYQVASILNVAKVFEDPFTSSNEITVLGKGDEAEYLNLITDERISVAGKDTVKDTYIKIKLYNGLEGWIARSLAQLTPRTTVAKKTWARQCYNLNDPLCGYEPILHSKVLYFAAARDILLSFIIDSRDVMEVRLEKFLAKNTTYLEYNTILKSAFSSAVNDRSKIISRLNIRNSCFVDDFKKDARNNTPQPLAKTPIIEQPIVEKKIDKPIEQQIVEKKIDKPIEQPIVEKPTEKPVLQIPVVVEKPDTRVANQEISKSDNTVKPKKDSLTNRLVLENTTVENAETKKAVNKENVDNTSSTTVIETKKTFGEVDKINKQLDKNKPQSESSPVENTKPDKTDVVVVTPKNPTTKVETGILTPVSFTSDNNKIEFDNAQEIVPLRDMPGYIPDGKPLIFRGLVIGEDLPSFKLVDMTGKEVLQQELLGKVVFIDFWASWCGPCQAQLTHTQGMQERFKDKNVVFLYISLDQDQEAWRFAVNEKKLGGIQANDPTIVPINFMVQALPNYFIIDKNGKIALNSLIKSKVDADKMLEFLSKQQTTGSKQ